jgi:hypothetical protein
MQVITKDYSAWVQPTSEFGKDLPLLVRGYIVDSDNDHHPISP